MHAVRVAPCRPSQPPGTRPPSSTISPRSQAVTFDPFGDFATEGYLRNFEKEKDIAIVKRAENASFTTGLDEAFAYLTEARVLAYDDVLKTHTILFGAVYPWAGRDRTQTSPSLTIKKGPVIFVNAPEIRPAVEF